MKSLQLTTARVSYYASNGTTDVLVPHALYRAKLERLLKAACADPSIVAQANYCNKLPRGLAGAASEVDIAHLPMDRSYYYYDLKQHARYFPRRLRLNLEFGDITHVPDRPAIVKSRPIGGHNAHSVLMKLDQIRHFQQVRDPIPFLEKQPYAVWRGMRHHSATRQALVERYHGTPLCDVGFIGGADDDPLRKAFLPPKRQMQYRYIISIEGNDVASNLKWILGSNCLCLMPKPRNESWFMEGRLEAGRHYVELCPDLDDLEDKLRYYEAHPDEAVAIIQQARAYTSRFYDRRRERLLGLLVLYKYFVATEQIEPDPEIGRVLWPT